MSAAEDDTELRDLLVQNLENSGVLNKLKAEMRAAVFLAMEDQDRLENKAPMVNQSLRRCLDTREGRLVASLIVDFLQVFNLDFSLSVFQPEINWLNGPDGRDQVSRDQVCKELGLNPTHQNQNQNSPLLLELVRRGRNQEAPPPAEVQKDPDVDRAWQPPEDRTGPPAVSKDSDSVSKAEQAPPSAGGGLDLDLDLEGDQDQDLDLEGDQDPDEGDSFFDDPLPKPQKTYGGLDPGAKGGPSGSRPDTQRPGAGTSPPEPSRTGASRGVRGHSDRSASLHLDDDVEYDDDFNSHRSDLSKSELSIGEEIEEVSIEGPDASEKMDDTTQDLSVSRLSPAADYMEDVS